MKLVSAQLIPLEETSLDREFFLKLKVTFEGLLFSRIQNVKARTQNEKTGLNFVEFGC